MIRWFMTSGILRLVVTRGASILYPDITANVKYEDDQPVVWNGEAFVSMESYCSDRDLVLLGIIDNSAAEWFDTALFSRKKSDE